MIEIIYNDEQQEEKRNEPNFQLPKNIRQIGEIDKGKKIYIEDYAVTYINQLSQSMITDPCVAILLGRVNWLEGTQYIFISSVLDIEEIDLSNERIGFTEEVWTNIYEKVKQFFVNQEIIGWFYSVPGFPLEVTDNIYRVHMNHFSGNDKVLMMREPIEKEEAFFLFENCKLNKQAGYYIYYEKNTAMQEYMIHRNQGKSVESKEEISDKAIQNFRRILEEKKEVNSPKKLMAFMYSASVFLVMTVLVIGITMINSHDKMRNIETTLDNLSKSLEVENAGNIQSTDSIQVENVNGGVFPLPETTGEENQTPPQSDQQIEETKAAEDQGASSGEGQSADNEAQTQSADTTDVQAPVTEYPTSINDYYVIQQGDTLVTISKSFYGNADRVSDIKNANGIEDENKIFPGQNILLP